MCTNAEFKLLLSQQTIQQSIYVQYQITQFRTPLSPKQSSNERTNWLNSYEWRKIGSAWTNGTRLHAKSTWPTCLCSQMWIMRTRATIQSHRRRPSRSGLVTKDLTISRRTRSSRGHEWRIPIITITLVQEICKYEKVEYCRLVGIVCTQRAGEITLPPARQVRIGTDSDPVSNCVSPVSTRARLGQIRALEWAPLNLWY